MDAGMMEGGKCSMMSGGKDCSMGSARGCSQMKGMGCGGGMMMGTSGCGAPMATGKPDSNGCCAGMKDGTCSMTEKKPDSAEPKEKPPGE